MFEAAELGRKVGKKEFKKREEQIRIELLELQQEVRRAGAFPVIILFAGVDGAGKGETMNKLNEWMDPRWIRSLSYDAPSDEERERPFMWRYWRDLPPKGQMGIFMRSWYSQPVLDHVYKKIDDTELQLELSRMMTFEKMLADDGALILKFWMHLGQDAQKRRLKALEKDPLLSYKVTDQDWKHWEMYDDFISTAEQTIMKTSTGQAPWMVVEGEDAFYRELAVAEYIRDALKAHLDRYIKEKTLENVHLAEHEVEHDLHPEKEAKKVKKRKPLTLLDNLDMTQEADKKSYKEELAQLQARLNDLSRKARALKLSSILVFEGWDAAGKGGAIRRLSSSMDNRNVRIVSVAAPTDEEHAQHYLWRFWRHLQRDGKVTVFDRSWYGRVLVERIEGFAKEEEWRRSFAEINEFERQLVDHGILVLKFWVHITKEEQLERFKLREVTPWKSWKLTEEDWRNRHKWDDYETAVEDMIERTSTSVAPWVLVEGNDKKFSRLKILRTYCEQLEQAIAQREGGSPAPAEAPMAKSKGKKKK